MKNKILFSFFCCTLFFGCKKKTTEPFNPTKGNTLDGKPIMEISYNIKSIKVFDVSSFSGDNNTLSELDRANLNPSNEEQSVHMKLFKDGRIHVVLKQLDFEEKIVLPHTSLPDNSPQVTKIEIIGNNASLYDRSGSLIGIEAFQFPNQKDLVDKIIKIGDKYPEEVINKVISTMQGQELADDLESYLKNSVENGIQILKETDDVVVIKASLSQASPTAEGNSTVMIINKKINKLMGVRIYSASEELLQTTVYGYDTGEIQALKVIMTEELLELPSGAKVPMFTNSNITNLKIDINI